MCINTSDLVQVEHIRLHAHPLISATKKKGALNLFPCAACDETMPGPIYACPDCMYFYLHKKCVELPPKITQPSHRKHPLLLLTKAPQHHQVKGFVYHCSLCGFVLKIKHVFSSQLVTGSHEHPFNLVAKPMTFICDACGTAGDNIPYICTTCNLVVHKDCIWLPKIIKIGRHVHPISHLYSLSENEWEIRWDCQICYGEVNAEYGSYYCSDCKYIVHVHCAVDKSWLEVDVDDQKHYEYLRSILDASGTSAEDVTATEIKHFSYQHILKLGEEMKQKKSTTDHTIIYCDGCIQVIISGHPFYFCELYGDFFLHKWCAKLPMKVRYWLAPSVLLLMPYGIFKCVLCNSYSSGFKYSVGADGILGNCLRCFAISDRLKHRGHEHLLFIDLKRGGHCSACGNGIKWGHRCKDCNFVLDFACISLPQTTWHKDDEHPLTLTYHDDVDGDPSQYFCDVCEEERNPSHWFYHCPDCKFSAHPKCTLGKYPFIKRGIKFRHQNHPHRLVSVQKVYDYPPCQECHKPCLDLAAECEEPECNYICHWECLQFPDFFPISD